MAGPMYLRNGESDLSHSFISAQKGKMMNEIITYCDIYECQDCPRYGDDCDGNGNEEM